MIGRPQPKELEAGPILAGKTAASSYNSSNNVRSKVGEVSIRPEI
eukprot:CAMPEP_0195066760 /NCGR_PEP_ID=MMETSP0448-20130528/12019_1 /TAXON_ID=66468 /ORGANISM="Heterocapsa triquestra, Strain CCMP 448" /LENGTH=44 /DNA_ID= /DNA_START= /DNA_END= /DNA_ORIENTATION=